MYALTVMSAAMVQAIPAEYVIDCGAVPIPITSKVKLFLEAKDGSKVERMIEVFRGADREVFAEILIIGAKDTDWVIRQGPGNTVIVSGTRSSGIKSVRVTSDGWAPFVERRLINVAQAPPPRVVGQPKK